MSVTTSMRAGRFAVSARAMAGPLSARFSTRIPTAPMSPGVRRDVAFAEGPLFPRLLGWRPAIDAIEAALGLVAARIVIDHRDGVDAPARGGLDLGDVVPETGVARERDDRP